MRGWTAAVVLAAITGAGWAEESRVRARAVDLNAPGAVQELMRADPARLGKVVSVLARAGLGTSEEFARTVRAHAEGSAGQLSSIVRLTYPPQRDFSFTLGGTTYSGRTNLALRAALMEALGQ